MALSVPSGTCVSFARLHFLASFPLRHSFVVVGALISDHFVSPLQQLLLKRFLVMGFAGGMHHLDVAMVLGVDQMKLHFALIAVLV